MCFILGVLVFVIALSTSYALSLKDYRLAGAVLASIGVILLIMSALRRNTVPHDMHEFPAVSLTMFLTGGSLFCCVIASVISGGGI